MGFHVLLAVGRERKLRLESSARFINREQSHSQCRAITRKKEEMKGKGRGKERKRKKEVERKRKRERERVNEDECFCERMRNSAIRIKFMDINES